MESAFPDDHGEQPAEVRAALEAYADDAAQAPRVLAALQSTRLLVPVVAIADEVEYDAAGHAHDKSSDMAAVLMTGRDGRVALLAFTGTAQLGAWNPEARPVAVPAPAAARAAVQEEASALVIDVGGPTPFVLEGEDLLGLASGWMLTTVGGRSAWLRPE